jgi:hypothetical protein
MSLQDVIVVLFPALKGGEVVSERDSYRGRVQQVRCVLNCLDGVEVEVEVCYGAWPGGAPKLTDDRSKRLVYLVGARRCEEE